MKELDAGSATFNVILNQGGGIWRVEVWTADASECLITRSYPREESARKEFARWTRVAEEVPQS